MSKISRTVTKIILWVVVILFVIYAALNFAAYAITAAFFFSALLLSRLLATASTKKPYLKIGALSYLIIVIVGYYSLSRDSADPLLTSSLAVVNLALINITVDLDRSKRVENILTIQRFFKFSLVAFIVYLACSSIAFRFKLGNERASLWSSQQLVIQKIDQRQKESLEIASSLSHDPVLIDLLNNQKLNDLSEYLRNVLIAKNLSYLAATDSMGTVIAKSHDPRTIGGNIAIQNPAILPVFRGETFKGIVKSEDWPVTLLAGSPILIQDKVVGAIFAGDFFSDSLTLTLNSNPKSSLIICGNEGVYLANSGSLLNSSESKILCQQFKTQINPTLLDLDNRHFVFTQRELLDPTGSQLGKLILAKEGVRVPVVTKIMTIVSVVIAVVFYVFSCFQSSGKKKWLEKLQKIRQLVSNLSVSRHIRFLQLKQVGVEIVRITLIIMLPIAFATFSTKVLVESFSDKSSTVVESNQAEPPQTVIFTKLDKNTIRSGEKVNAVLYATSLGSASVDAQLDFAASVTKINSVNFDGSVCTSNLSKSIDNEKGHFSLSCDIKSDLPKSSKYTFATIQIEGIRPGISTVMLDQDKSKGIPETNFAAVRNQGTFYGDYIVVLDNAGKIVSQIPILPPSGWLPGWNKVSKFTPQWLTPTPSLPVKYCLGKSPGACDSFYITENNQATISVPDGLWYLTIAPIDPKLSYLQNSLFLQVDVTPPDELKPLISDDEIDFTLKDNAAGIDALRVTIDGKLYENASSPFKLPPLSPGQHTADAKVTDNAGNSRTYDFVINR